LPQSPLLTKSFLKEASTSVPIQEPHDGEEGKQSEDPSTLNVGKQNRVRRNSINIIMGLPRKSIDLLRAHLFGNVPGSGSPAPHSLSDTAIIKTDKLSDDSKDKQPTVTKMRVGTEVPFTKWTRKMYGSEKAVAEER